MSNIFSAIIPPNQVGVYADQKLGYSFGLAIVAFILSVFATTLGFIAYALHRRRHVTTTTYTTPHSHVNVVKTEEVIVTRS